MATTRLGLETILFRQGGKLLGMVGLDILTVDGTNPDLGPVIGAAMLEQGLDPADIANPTGDELAGVSGVNLKRLIDVMGLYLLELVLSRWAYPDTTADTDNKQDLGKLRDSIEKTVARRRAQLEKEYGLGLGSLSTGTIDLGFMATLDDDGGCR